MIRRALVAALSFTLLWHLRALEVARGGAMSIDQRSRLAFMTAFLIVSRARIVEAWLLGTMHLRHRVWS